MSERSDLLRRQFLTTLTANKRRAHLGSTTAAFLAFGVLMVGTFCSVNLPAAKGLATPVEPPPNRVLHGHKGSVLWVAFTPDGKILASGSRDHRVIIWDVATGNPMKVLSEHQRDVYCVRYSPDGKTLATAAGDNRICLWSVPAYALKETLWADGLIRNISFAPDGKTLASGGYDKEVTLWDLDKPGSKTKSLTGYTGNIQTVEYSADGRYLLTGGMEEDLHIWDVNGFWLKILRGPERSYEEVAISPDGKTVVGNSSAGSIIVWDLASGKIVKTLNGLGPKGHSLAYRFDGRILATGNRDKTITLWDTATWQPQAVLTGNQIESMAFSPDGKTFAVGGGGGETTIKLWDCHDINFK